MTPSKARPTSSGRARSATIQPARRIAFEVITAVRESDSYANLLLPTKIQRASLSTADAGLATELTYGTLRMMGYYDRVIEDASGRSVSAIDASILDVLRLGAHQLLSMRIPAHAAVNESVALARTVGSQSATGFCNGVLREITRHTPAEWRERVLDEATGANDRLAAEYSHPTWVIRAFRQSLRSEGRGDELEALLAADNLAPRVNLIALPGLAAVPADAPHNAFSPVGFVLAGGDPAHIVAESRGLVRVQDEGSQLAALALTRARPIGAGERWLDLCSGPGGKAAVLAAEAHLSGATLVANELVPARVQLVRSAVAPLPGHVEFREGDGTTIGVSEPASYDRILLDAPCTGLGALRRRPEARWRKRPSDVPELSALQSALLDSAIAALKPGGILAYVTCSPHVAETKAVVDDALRRWEGELQTLSAPDVLRAVSRSEIDLGETGDVVQLWPHRHGTDAMFIALLTRPPVTGR